MDECEGCKYDKPTIENAIGKCTHCKRAYHCRFERDIHEDLYEKEMDE